MKHFANTFNPTFQNHHGNKSTHAKQFKSSWLRITLWLKSPPHHLLNKGRMENQQQELGWFRKTKNDVEMLKGLLTSTKGLEKKLDLFLRMVAHTMPPKTKILGDFLEMGLVKGGRRIWETLDEWNGFTIFDCFQEGYDCGKQETNQMTIGNGKCAKFVEHGLKMTKLGKIIHVLWKLCFPLEEIWK